MNKEEKGITINSAYQEREIRELNERLARFEFGDNFMITGEIIVYGNPCGGGEYLEDKPLYTDSLDSCLPLLISIREKNFFEFDKILKDFHYAFQKSEAVAHRVAITIDKAIND